MVILYVIPLQDDIYHNKIIDIIFAPPGLHDVVLYSYLSKG